MATVYSLICWGGRTGKTVTLTDAGDIVNSTNHGLRDGTPVQFASGTMPSGMALDTTYYVKSTGTGTFTLYTTDALTTQVTWTGSGTGPFVLKSKAAIDCLASPPTPERWGAAGAERCYDGLVSWASARKNVVSFDIEFAEVGEAFTETNSTGQTWTFKSGAFTIESTINGAYTSAFHGGVKSAGYVLSSSAYISPGNSYYASIKGVQFSATAAVNPLITTVTGLTVARCIFSGIGSGTGVSWASRVANLYNNWITGFFRGLSVSTEGYGNLIAGNLITDCGTGVYPASTSSIFGFFYNNLAFNNTTNWGAQPAGIEGASNNAGASGDTVWTVSGGTTITVSASDFVAPGSGDYSPSGAAAAQVDAGAVYYNAYLTDLAGEEMPNYNNGGAEAVDIGCYEFDNGFGPHPASTTVTFQGVNAGSEIRVYDASANDLAGVESCTADPSLTWNVAAGQQRIVIIHPDYRIKEFNYTNVAGSVTLPVQQEVDRWFSNP